VCLEEASAEVIVVNPSRVRFRGVNDWLHQPASRSPIVVDSVPTPANLILTGDSAFWGWRPRRSWVPSDGTERPVGDTIAVLR
jgi:hypothetical protein